MNKLKKTDFNFNYICATAYRVLLLLKFLTIRGLTKQEITKLLAADEFVIQKINSETIRSMINSLKSVGCEISRPAKSNNYEYRIIKNPFLLSLSDNEIKLINKFRKKTLSKNDWKDIININSFIDKLCLVIDDKEIKEKLKNNKLLAEVDYSLIKRISICCKNKSRVIFKYLSHRKISDFEMITSFIKYEKNKMYVWGFSTKYNDFSYIRLDKIRSLEVKEKFSQKIYNKSVIRYEMFDKDYELEENEILVKTTDTSMIIDYKYESEFHSIQKFLEKGDTCRIIAPDLFKNKFISVLKSIKGVYKDE